MTRAKFRRTPPKKPEVIINGGNRVDIIGQTTNVLELENLTDETQYFCFVSEDEYGNRMNFYDYEKIPTYVAPGTAGTAGRHLPDCFLSCRSG